MDTSTTLTLSPGTTRSEGMWLTEPEIVDLTGRTRPSLQRSWLDSNGVAYFTSASGRPKVLRSTLERRHGPQTDEGSRPPASDVSPALDLLLRQRRQAMASARQG